MTSVLWLIFISGQLIVLISQLLRYVRASLHYRDFLITGRLLILKLLSQGYVKPRLEASPKKSYGPHHVKW